MGYVRELELRIDAVDLDIVMLIHPERGDRLELLHRPGSVPGLRASTPPEAVLTEGFGHVCFDVAGVDPHFDRLVALGAIEIVAPLRIDAEGGTAVNKLVPRIRALAAAGQRRVIRRAVLCVVAAAPQSA